MKKLFLGLACIAGVGAFFLGQKTPQKASDLSLENIETVGLSSAEMACVPAMGETCYAYDCDGNIIGMMANARLEFID